jgi:hypothetical protein
MLKKFLSILFLNRKMKILAAHIIKARQKVSHNIFEFGYE